MLNLFFKPATTLPVSFLNCTDTTDLALPTASPRHVLIPNIRVAGSVKTYRPISLHRRHLSDGGVTTTYLQ